MARMELDYDMVKLRSARMSLTKFFLRYKLKEKFIVNMSLICLHKAIISLL